MAKKRSRITNPEPFLYSDNGDKSNTSSARKRPKTPKHHQQPEEIISSGISSKILKEALLQQKEIEEEEAREQNPNFVFPEEPKNTADDGADEDDDIDDFGGFSETRSQFGGWEEVDFCIIDETKFSKKKTNFS